MTDESLAQDEQDVINEGETVSSRTRGATKASGTYTEPGDEEVSVFCSVSVLVLTMK